MQNWAVSSANEAYLDEIRAAHTVKQLPTYDINTKFIAPLDYEEKVPSLEFASPSSISTSNKNTSSTLTLKTSLSFDLQHPSLLLV